MASELAVALALFFVGDNFIMDGFPFIFNLICVGNLREGYIFYTWWELEMPNKISTMTRYSPLIYQKSVTALAWLPMYSPHHKSLTIPIERVLFN